MTAYDGKHHGDEVPTEFDSIYYAFILILKTMCENKNVLDDCLIARKVRLLRLRSNET